jgi:hypothetical protein
MIRTVPKTGSDEIELYIRTFYSLLRSTEPIQLQALEEVHKGIRSSLHNHAREIQIDVSTLVYCTLRLPACIFQTQTVVLGQIEEDFIRAGYGPVEKWERVHASSRRRRTHFDGHNILAAMIASRSDIEDILPTLVALQIEWNKVHKRMQHHPNMIQRLELCDENTSLSTEDCSELAEILQLSDQDIFRLQQAWETEFEHHLCNIARRRFNLSLKLLAGSMMNYRKAVGRWWKHLNRDCADFGYPLQNQSVYFVSSNTHSIPNLLSGFASQIEPELKKFIQESDQEKLQAEWQGFAPQKFPPNFLYYLLRHYQQGYPDAIQHMIETEEALGLRRIPAKHGFDVEGQISVLKELDPARLDRRISQGLDVELLKASDAVIVNIDYPLGMAAFDLLTRISEGSDTILGIYVMGKAATLNGRIGDMMLADVVYDEQSNNSYLFDNCFNVSHIAPYLNYGMLLDHQKAVTVRGTFLQNDSYLDVFYKEGYTVLEMEAGPYLSAIYEMIRPKRHPSDEIVNLYSANFDFGLIHYASDIPFSKGHNLGTGSLGFQGLDSTYAASIAILRRIFSQEIQRIQQQHTINPKRTLSLS